MAAYKSWSAGLYCAFARHGSVIIRSSTVTRGRMSMAIILVYAGYFFFRYAVVSCLQGQHLLITCLHRPVDGIDDLQVLPRLFAVYGNDRFFTSQQDARKSVHLHRLVGDDRLIQRSLAGLAL